MTQDLVLIDTSIWISFFNRPHSAVKHAVEKLLKKDRAALIGLILAEVLCGFHRDAQADWGASILRGLHYFDLTWDDWRASARLSRQHIGTDFP
jgi:predicted nucleic acid-binding protein